MTVFQNLQQTNKMLHQLSHILDKTTQYAAERKIDPDSFLDCRVVADMFPLRRQIQMTTDNAKGFAYRLSGRDIPSFEDNPHATMEDLKARVKKTIGLLSEFKEEDFKNFEQKQITMKFIPDKYQTGLDYYLQMAVPNFYFHLTTIYNILRSNGVPLGKADFLGPLILKDI